MTIQSIFLDGEMVKARPRLIESLVPGIVQGKGVFETMRLFNGTIFMLEEHLGRLFRGLKTFKIQPPYSKGKLKQYLYQTIKMNTLKEARIRLAVWKTDQRLHIAIVCQNIGKRSDAKYKEGFKAILTDVQRNKTRYSNIKSMDYSCFRTAFQKAQEEGCDEAILLNNRRELVEGSRTNIFYIKDQMLFTPAVKCGCLSGITRKIVIQCARRLKITCRAVAADIGDLLKSDEAFVTNSLIGVMPLTVIDGKMIGRGKMGPLTQKILQTYQTLTPI